MAVFDAGTQERLAQLAADLVSPVGRLPFERVARRHAELLGEFRDQGLTWTQIGLLLHRHGIARQDGSPLSGAQLSSVACRQQKQLPPQKSTLRQASGASFGRESVNHHRPTGQAEPLPAVAQVSEGSKVRIPETPMDRAAIKAALAHQKAIRDRMEEGKD